MESNEKAWSVASLKKSVSMSEYWDCPQTSINEILGQNITLLGAIAKDTCHGKDRRLLHIRLDNGEERKLFTNGSRLKQIIDAVIDNNAFPLDCKVVKIKSKNKEVLDLVDKD